MNPVTGEVWECIIFDYFQQSYKVFLMKTDSGWVGYNGKFTEDDALPQKRVFDVEGNIY